LSNLLASRPHPHESVYNELEKRASRDRDASIIIASASIMRRESKKRRSALLLKKEKMQGRMQERLCISSVQIEREKYKEQKGLS